MKQLNGFEQLAIIIVLSLVVVVVGILGVDMRIQNRYDKLHKQITQVDSMLLDMNYKLDVIYPDFIKAGVNYDKLGITGDK